MRACLVGLAFLISVAPATIAGPENFSEGTVISGYGEFAAVGDARLGAENVFHVAYDVSAAGPEDGLNRSFVTPARFLNMHANTGVLPENMHLAVIVHGGAHKALLASAARGAESPNEELIARLVDAGVIFELCGQTAGYYYIAQDDLLPGVTISLSAMTSHALLQQQGYTLNPF